MSDETDQDGDELLKGGGPSIDAQGRLEGRFNNVEAQGGPPPPQEVRLELDARPRAPVEERMQTYRAELAARNQRPWALKLVIGSMLLGIVALGAFLYFKPKLSLPEAAIPTGVQPSGLVAELTGSTEAAPIVISSSPSGARVIIGGKTVGETPWAGDNRWVGETAVTLELDGYKTWVGKFKGGEPQTLDIALRR